MKPWAHTPLSPFFTALCILRSSKKKSDERTSYISGFTFLSDTSVYTFVKYPQVKLSVDTQTHIHKLNISIIKMLFSFMILQRFVSFYVNFII